MNRPPRYGRPHLRAVGTAAVLVGLAVGGAAAWALRPGAGEPTMPPSGSSGMPHVAPSSGATTPMAPPTPSVRPTASPAAVGIGLAAHSATDPASIWVVVNKQHPIQPLDYAPGDLVSVAGAQVRSVVEPDLQAMFDAAEADGVRLGLRTAYRSYGSQAAIRADVEQRRGFAHAERYSARPGYSEHQTGLSFDLHSTSNPGCDLATCFADTAEGQWVAAHAARYGFLVRYTPGNTELTGFAPEAWHLRYVGREMAGWMTANGIGSLEEALGVTGGQSYPD